MSGPIEQAIKQTLTDNLEPVHIELINESYMHNVPKGSESHFKVLVVSQKFQDLPLIKVPFITSTINAHMMVNVFTRV